MESALASQRQYKGARQYLWAEHATTTENKAAMSNNILDVSKIPDVDYWALGHYLIFRIATASYSVMKTVNSRMKPQTRQPS